MSKSCIIVRKVNNVIRTCWHSSVYVLVEYLISFLIEWQLVPSLLQQWCVRQITRRALNLNSPQSLNKYTNKIATIVVRLCTLHTIQLY